MCRRGRAALNVDDEDLAVGGDQHRHDDDSLEHCRALRAGKRAEPASFADDIPRFLSSRKPTKSLVPQVVVAGSLKELDLAGNHRFSRWHSATLLSSAVDPVLASGRFVNVHSVIASPLNFLNSWPLVTGVKLLRVDGRPSFSAQLPNHRTGRRRDEHSSYFHRERQYAFRWCFCSTDRANPTRRAVYPIDRR